MGKPIWECGNGHQFEYDDFGQAWGIPTHCFEERTDEEFVEEYGAGEPCLDSSVLDAVNVLARRAAREWNTDPLKPDWLR